ncbi:hypothetical protein [Microseira wollei]|uniref:hypothetical protein n=1 Tax=Microseira wollei TaxID=467598 RepID=UPI001CFC9194|nr:hypothetical protein [Microseira wollei]
MLGCKKNNNPGLTPRNRVSGKNCGWQGKIYTESQETGFQGKIVAGKERYTQKAKKPGFREKLWLATKDIHRNPVSWIFARKFYEKK